MTKRCLALVTALFLLLSMIPPVSAAEAGPCITVSSGSVTQGNSLYMQITAEQFANVGSVDFTLYYDAEAFTVTDTYTGNMIDDSTSFLSVNTAIAGQITVSAVTMDAFYDSGTLLYMYLQAADNSPVKSYPLALTVGNAYGTDLMPISVSSVSGKVTVNQREPEKKPFYLGGYCMNSSSFVMGDSFVFRLQNNNYYSGYRMASGDIAVEYDPTLFRVDSVELLDAMKQEGAVWSVNTDIAGKILISYASADNILSSELMDIHFTVIGNRDTYSYIEYSASNVYDETLFAYDTYNGSCYTYISKTEEAVDYPDLWLETPRLVVGQQVTSVLMLQEGAGVAAGDFVVSYDTSVMRCVSVTAAPGLSAAGGMVMVDDNFTDGTIEFPYINAEGYDEIDIPLVQIVWEPLCSNANHAVAVPSGSMTYDADFQPVSLEYVPETECIFVRTLIAPTCLEDGRTNYTCACGESIDEDIVNKLGHDIQKISPAEPDCENIGWNAHESCSRCDYNTREEIPALGHDEVVHQAQVQTCLGIGWDTYITCNRCDYSTYEQLPALGHRTVISTAVLTDPLSLEFVGETPFVLEDGKYYSTNHTDGAYAEFYISALYDCQLTLVGGVSSEQNFDKLMVLRNGGNIWEISGVLDNQVFSLDLTAGEVITIRYHKDGSVSNYDDRCWVELQYEFVMAEGFADAPSETLEPDCVNAVVCSYCDTVVKKALGHDEISHEAKAPTCLDIGWEAYVTCSRCDYTTYEELPALGHDEVVHQAREQTCLGVGWEEYVTCSRCDHTTYEELPALGHRTEVIRPGLVDPLEIDLGEEIPFVLENGTYYSNNHESNSVSRLTITAQLDCQLTLITGVSSEQNYDKLVVFRGNEQLLEISGQAGQTLDLDLYAGETITVQYQKDGSVEYYDDRGWVSLQYDWVMGECPEDVPSEELEPDCVNAVVCTYCGEIVKETISHDYQSIFQWNENHTDCQVLLVCRRDCGTQATVSCSVEEDVSDPAKTVHVATAEHEGQTFTETLSCDNHLVVFQNWDGQEVSRGYFHLGRAVDVPTAPTKEADDTYTYAFTGWNPQVTECRGDAVYTAVFEPAYIDYTVTFKNWDGTVLQEKTYHYGDVVTAPAAPTKAADNTYTYSFTGWDQEVTSCAGNAVYTAVFEAAYIDYTVTFKDWDGTILQQKTYHYGDKVTAPAAPARAADNTYTYAFTGWDREITDCTGEMTYTAVYTSTYIDYTVIFKNWDGTVISQSVYHYGDTVVIPDVPEKPSGVESTYVFVGWDKTVVPCAGDTVYTAVFSSVAIDYTVTFKDWNGAILQEQVYHYGDVVTAPAAPTKAADNTYTYTFTGWDKEVTPCAGDVEYIAVFEAVYIDYTVTFKNWNGAVLQEKTYHYGDVVTAPADPAKAADNTYTYAFTGWDKEVTVCAGNVVYTAVYEATYIDYTVIFKDWNGAVLQEKTYHYGDVVTAPAAPTKAADNTYTYTFTGWDKEVTSCAGNTVYTAVFEAAYIDYTVTFKDWNGAVLQEKTYHYGDKVTAPAAPTKAADNTYIYAFAGWDKLVISCEGNATYTATYTPVYIDYTVTFKNWDGAVLQEKTYHYGDVVTAPAAPTKAADNTYTYAFTGWDKEVTACAGNVVYTAVYEATYIDYTVIFKDWNSAVLQEKTYHYGDVVTVPAAPTKAADNTYTYTFTGWDQEVTSCAGNAVYTAVFEAAYIDYTVTFKDWDGTILQQKTYHYGDKVTAPAAPARTADNTYTYVFAAWDREITDCTGEMTYTAVYTSTYIDYTVIFKNWDGTVISQSVYHYGDTVVIPDVPEKPSGVESSYVFVGWDKTVVPCAGDTVYTAVFSSVAIDYTVTFKDWNGAILQEKIYHYGDVVTAPAAPAKEADNTYTYTFVGWDKEVTICTGSIEYTAVFEAAYIDYTVTFKDWNGTVLQEKTYHYGDVVTAPAAPTKAADNTYTYAFTGWDKEVTACAGNVVYTAVYEATYIDYTVIFKDWNGAVLQEKTYHYGDKVTAPAAPTKAADNTYTYTFTGWDKEVISCEGNAVYTATYAPVYIDYTVTFKNWDGTVLQEQTYHYGDAVAAPATPVKAADNTYTYTFTGWDKKLTNCAGNAVYTAVFEAVYIEYTVVFKNADGSVLQEKTYHYGDAVVAPGEPTPPEGTDPTWVFKGWDAEISESCAGNAVYTAVFAQPYPRGDMNCDMLVTDADAVYLLRHTLFAEEYPIYQSGDFNGDGRTTDADAVYLLRHTLFPDEYPLN